MNGSDYISSKRDSRSFDFDKNFANDKLLFESYENQLSKISIEDASSIEKTWDKKIYALSTFKNFLTN